MEQISKNTIEELKKNIHATVQDLNIPDKKSTIGALQTKSMEPDFWEDQNNAKKIMQEIDHLSVEVQSAETLQSQVDSLLDLFEMSDPDEQQQLAEDYFQLEKEFRSFQTLKYLSGKYDTNPAILSIHAGQGGTEANDWAEMLQRMYQRYAESKGWMISVQSLVPGTETGISSVRILIDGKYAYGMLKLETGTHRLVRLSPFNSQNLRQTSFAGIEVIPLIEDADTTIEIRDEDIEFKAVRSSGAGGQSVNKTSSAVQITHIPSGISVHNSEHRYQEQNRKAAMQILKARLWLIEEEKRKQEMASLKGKHQIAGWGNQIRNYVLHPYKLVKDLRTEVESSNPEKVLDGDIQEFIDAEIRIS